MAYVEAYEAPFKHRLRIKSRVFDFFEMFDPVQERRQFACGECGSLTEFDVPFFMDSYGGARPCWRLSDLYLGKTPLIPDTDLVGQGVCRENTRENIVFGLREQFTQSEFTAYPRASWLYRRFFCPSCGQGHMMVFASAERYNGAYCTWISGVWSVETV